MEEKGQEGQDVLMARQKGLGVLHGVSSTSFVGPHHDEVGGGLLSWLWTRLLQSYAKSEFILGGVSVHLFFVFVHL